MGTAMATKLLDEGFAVDVWNRSPKNVDDLLAKGAGVVDLAQSLKNPVVISMLSNDAASLATFSAENLALAAPGIIHVNMSTLSPETARELAQRHESAGIGYVSAPVLGRPIAVLSGKILIVSAGKPDYVSAVEPIFNKISAKHWNVGDDPGTSSLVKLGVNYNIIHALQAIAESVALVEAGGVDANTFIEIITHTAFTGSAYAGYGPMIAKHSFTPPGFTMELGLKDVRLVEDAATNLGLKLPVAPVLRQLFEQALEDPELRPLDWSAVSELTRQRKL